MNLIYNLDWISPFFRVDWMMDRYSADFDIYGYTLGITSYVNQSTLNLTGKDAFDFTLGTSFTLKGIDIKASFSQHIPYKFYFNEMLADEQVDPNEDYSGGGLFKLEIIKILD